MKILAVVLALLGVGAFIVGSQLNRRSAEEASVTAGEAKRIAVAACRTSFGEMSSILRDSRRRQARERGLTPDSRDFYRQRLDRLRPENCERAVERELRKRKGGEASAQSAQPP